MPLHHEIAGDGPTVLLLHAGVADSRMWEPQFHALARTHRVIAPDLPGFGRSPIPETDFVMAHLLAELLDGPATVVGSSLGGWLALELATLHPRLVERLVLLCPPVWTVKPTGDVEAVWRGETALREAGDLDGAAAFVAERWVGPHASPAAVEMVQAMQRQAYDLQARPAGEEREVEVILEDIRAPAEVFTGAHDFDWFAHCASHLVERLAHATHTELDWAGHLPTLEHPAAGLELLRASLAR
jgi:pimeloyl-ACP methyl ester carboxylesterase